MATFDLISIGNHEFELMRWSSDEPVGLLLPGAMGGIRGYTELGTRLASLGVPLVGMNPRGCGKSSGPLQGVTAHELVQDVIAVVSTVVALPALLVGHAGGNRLVRMAANLRPELFVGVVLLAAGGSVGPDRQAREEMLRLVSGDYSDDAERLSLAQSAFFAPTSTIPDGYGLQPDLSPAFARAFATAIQAVKGDDLVGGGQSQMLIIQGRQDRIAPIANGHELGAAYPDRVKVVDLDDAGHALPVEQPHKIATLIAEFARNLTKST